MRSEVRLFGSFTVDNGGHPLTAQEFGGRKPKQLLEILALRAGRHVPKDRLARLLWGDRMPLNACGSLEHYVSLLRRRLDPAASPQQSLIVTEHAGYRFDTDKAWVDVHAFDEVAELAAAGKADRQQLEQAIGWVRGELLEDEPYAEWALETRTHYRQRYVQLVVTAAEQALADRDLVAARDLAQLAVGRDSLVEPAHRVLMLAAYARGDQCEALQSFHRARQVLADELGIDPMPATADLYQAILGQAPADSLLPPAVRPSVTIPSQRVTAPEQPAETPIDAGDAQGSLSVLLRQETDDVPRRRHDDMVPAEAQPSGRNAVPSLVESLRTASPDLLAVATVSAFVPQPCVPEGVARLTGLAPLHVAVVQERLCDLGVLRIDGEGFSFCRDEQRALLAATVSPARRRLLERAHRRVDSLDRRRYDRGAPTGADRRSPLPDRRAGDRAGFAPDSWQEGWPIALAGMAARVG